MLFVLGLDALNDVEILTDLPENFEASFGYVRPIKLHSHFHDLHLPCKANKKLIVFCVQAFIKLDLIAFNCEAVICTKVE